MPRAATLMSKAHKRVGVTFERSKTFKKDDNSDGSSYKDGKSFNMDNSERRRLRSRAERAQSIYVNADRIQKKGTYGSKNVGRREMSGGEDMVTYSKVSSKRNQRKVTYDSKTETIRSGKPRTMWVTKYKEAAKSAKLPSKSTSKAKKSAGMDDVGNGLFKKQDSNKSDFKASSDKIQNVGTTVYSQKTAKKIFRDDKSSVGDSEEQEVKPKKRKRIRLDPYDISNKRLDDTIVDDEATIEKKGPEKRAEMSKNAQFRAIQPSASIISFVEDNLLGRRRLIELKRAGYNTELPAPLDNIPFSKSTERENIEETIFRNRLEFFAAAKVSSSFPPPEVSEIAFAGRSNVGKSSLLNALTRQWGVVRTSDKPGHTQSINFFKLGPKFSLVDLPGYGFAYAKEEVKDAWEELVKEYVSTRVNLKRVCLLVDTKWGMKPRDQELIDLMERYQTKYQIVLTKTDTVFPIDVARRAMQIEENLKGHKSAVQPVMMASSKSGAGVRCLRTVLAKVARFAKV